MSLYILFKAMMSLLYRQDGNFFSIHLNCNSCNAILCLGSAPVTEMIWTYFLHPSNNAARKYFGVCSIFTMLGNSDAKLNRLSKK